MNVIYLQVLSFPTCFVTREIKLGICQSAPNLTLPYSHSVDLCFELQAGVANIKLIYVKMFLKKYLFFNSRTC